MANKTTPRQTPAQPVAPSAAVPAAAQQQQQQQPPSANAKKNKKKKAKKAAAAAAAGQQPNVAPADGGDGYDSEGYHYEDDEDLPALENAPGITFTNDFPYPPASGYGAGANAAAAAAAAMNGAMGAAFGGMLNGLDYPASGLSPSAHADLVNTATELYRRMEDPTFGETEEYWTSLPSHLRNFIRNALPIAPSGAFGSPPQAVPRATNGTDHHRSVSPLPQPNSNTMLAMAQQIVSAAHANAKGVMGQANGVGMPPFDPAALDFAFQPHPDYDLRAQIPGRPLATGQMPRQPNYMPGPPVGGVIMLDDRDQDEYDRCATGLCSVAQVWLR
jgi:hypothetical protein